MIDEVETVKLSIFPFAGAICVVGLVDPVTVALAMARWGRTVVPPGLGDGKVFVQVYVGAEVDWIVPRYDAIFRRVRREMIEPVWLN